MVGWLPPTTPPEAFAAAGRSLAEHLRAAGKDPARFPNAIATRPTLDRPEEELRQRLLVGPAEECAQKLAAYQEAGAQRIFLWPVEDELRQLATFQERVAPLVGR